MPSSHADLREQTELAKVVAEYDGVYAVHLRDYANGHRDAALDECVAVSEVAGIGLHVSHFSGVPETYAKAEAERARGIDVTWDAYPYTAGCTWLAYPLPSSLLTTDVPGIVEKLRSPQVRLDLRGPMAELYPPDGAAHFASLTLPQNKWMEGKQLREVWNPSHGSFEDFVCDLLIEEKLRPLAVMPWPGTLEETEARLHHTLTHPCQMVATDGVYVGGDPHPRGWGTYPRILGHYVRDKGWLPLEDAVRRMTGFPAQRFGLGDRGLLRKGMAADVVVFDPNTVRDRATYESPRVHPVGIEHVFVNSVQVVERGRLLDCRPGRVLRRHGS
jgi:N-acyl-D-amino-acid deacylase